MNDLDKLIAEARQCHQARGWSKDPLVNKLENLANRLANALEVAGAERDAALAAVERVRAIAEAYDQQPEERELCGAAAQGIRSALDGAPEPEWEEHTSYGVEMEGGQIALEPWGRNHATHQRTVRFGPWLPVEGEKP